MAITTNYAKKNPQMISRSPGKGADWCFTATKSDANYCEDPANAGRPVCAMGISVDIITDAVKVEFADGRTYTFAAGALAAGQMHRMDVVKVFSTGTGASVVVTVWVDGEPEAVVNLHA